VTTHLEQRNQQVLEVLSMATPLLKRMAWSWNLEYEELFQRAAEAALLNYEKAQEAEIPRAFLYGVVRNVLWYAPPDRAHASLDAPISRDHDARLADLLPAPPLFLVDPDHRMEKTRALYTALRKLPLEVQEYIARVHALNAYQPKRPKKGRFVGKRPNFSRDPSTLSRQAYAYLRKDRRLAHVVLGTPLLHETDFNRDWAEDRGEESASDPSFERDWA
jgi:hypothetical protein